jgi:hypothetical protein
LRGELGVGCEFHEEHNLTGTVDLFRHRDATGDARGSVNLTIDLSRADANASRIQHRVGVARIAQLAAVAAAFLDIRRR